jgi:hypothetical protein
MLKKIMAFNILKLKQSGLDTRGHFIYPADHEAYTPDETSFLA